MPPLKRKYRRVILLSSTAVIAYSLFVLGYGLGLYSRAIEAFAGSLPMALDSAACFIMAGTSLFLQVRYKSRNARIMSRAFALLVFTWTILLLLRDFTSLKIPFTFGMSPQTAFCFATLSVCFFFLNTTRKKYIIAMQVMLHLVTFTGTIVIIGHILDIPEFYAMTFIPMAIYSAIGFVLLSVVASLVNHKIGFTGLFTGDYIGNIMARRLFFQMLIAILIIGYIRILSHRQQWMSPELATAIQLVVFITVCLLLIWITSLKLNSIHIKRKIAEENFRIAVDAAPYALIISDRGGNITTINDCTRELYGYKKSELIGQNVKMLIPQKLHAEYDARKSEFYDTLKVTKVGTEHEIAARKKDGTEFPVEIIFTPIRSTFDNFTLATIIDITERKKQEEIIRNQLIELQLKNEEMEQFNYISSHDLQEPLRTISNYIEMIREDYEGQLDDDVKNHLDTMSAATGRMSHVVKSLLNFGKLGRKRKLTQTDCNEIIGEVKTDLDSLIKSSGATIEVTCRLPEFYAFKTELRQLFQNLISNAIKFQNDNGQPVVEVSTEKKGNYYEFSVSDNGIGIDPKHYDKIFRIFQRLNEESEYEGHGIGLANCKKIAEMHGGKIWVESEPGKGSTFKFTILNLQHE